MRVLSIALQALLFAKITNSLPSGYGWPILC